MSVGWSVGRSVGRVKHLFDDPPGAPYWPTWPCFFASKTEYLTSNKDAI